MGTFMMGSPSCVWHLMPHMPDAANNTFIFFLNTIKLWNDYFTIKTLFNFSKRLSSNTETVSQFVPTFCCLVQPHYNYDCTEIIVLEKCTFSKNVHACVFMPRWAEPRGIQ